MRNVVVCVALLATVAVASADTLEVRNKTHEGKLETFENGQFTFRILFGDTLSVSASSVKTLTLDKPRPVSLLLSEKSEFEDANLHGFQQSKFTVEQKGGMRMIYAMKVKRMVVKEAKPSATADSSEIPGLRAFVDITHIEDRTDLPPHQMDAMRVYVTARERYKAFLAESSRLVASANGETGDRRMVLLNELRDCKNREQPLLLALDQAEKALFVAFPPAE